MDELVSEVTELLLKVPAPRGYTLPQGASDDQLHAYEARTQLLLPVELKQWLRLCNGPLVGPGGLFGIPLEPEQPPVWNTIDEAFGVYPSWKDKGWIPVAGDGCGNYYVLATRGSGVETAKRPIYFVDTSMDREKPAYVVASDLWHFLRFILRDELGRDYWPFKKYRVLEEDPDLEEAPGAPKPWDT